MSADVVRKPQKMASDPFFPPRLIGNSERNKDRTIKKKAKSNRGEETLRCML